MNFLQKYDLRPITRYGKNYVAVENVGHVIHELESKVQFLTLEHNRLDSALKKAEALMRWQEDDRKESVQYYRDDRNNVFEVAVEAKEGQIKYIKKYDRAKQIIAFLVGSCALLVYKLVLGY